MTWWMWIIAICLLPLFIQGLFIFIMLAIATISLILAAIVAFFEFILASIVAFFEWLGRLINGKEK